jgi:hypothetical protein
MFYFLFFMGALVVPWILANFIVKYQGDQFQFRRKKKGGLWLCRNNFWIKDDWNMSDFEISVFKQEGWVFEDYRLKPPVLKVINNNTTSNSQETLNGS